MHRSKIKCIPLDFPKISLYPKEYIYMQFDQLSIPIIEGVIIFKHSNDNKNKAILLPNSVVKTTFQHTFFQYDIYHLVTRT